MPATAIYAEKLKDRKQFDAHIQRDHITALPYRLQSISLYHERPPRQVSCLWPDETTVIARNYDCILWTKEHICLCFYFHDRGPLYIPIQ